jgi:hypothetical protein
MMKVVALNFNQQLSKPVIVVLMRETYAWESGVE